MNRKARLRSAAHTTAARVTHTSRALSEPLEPRRLLAATFDTATGILRITSGNENAVILFEDVTADAEGAESRFQVLQGIGRANPPSGSVLSGDALVAYIAAADSFETHGPYTASQVRRAEIATGIGDDLIIVGRRARVAVDVFANAGNDTVSGGILGDTLRGNDGNDYLYGGPGDDLINPGGGNNIILGGEGDRDAVDYGDRGFGISVTFDGQANDGGGGDLVGDDVHVVIGGAGDDTLDASMRPNLYFDRDGQLRVRPPVALYGEDGNDTIRGTNRDQDALDAEAAALGVPASVYDGRGDTLVGGNGVDSIFGLGGNDLIMNETQAAGNVIDGGPGNNLFVGLDDDDTQRVTRLTPGQQRPGDATASESGVTINRDGVIEIAGTDGDDTALVSFGRRTEGSGVQFDFLRVSIARDGGQPVIREFPISNPADGSARTSPVPIALTFVAPAGRNVVYVGSPSEAQQNAGVALIPVTLRGGTGDDLLVGGDGNDLLDGGTGDNILFGRGGDDTLQAGFGRDDFFGGPGLDRVTYATRAANEPVRVGVGRLPDDGFTGENDNVRGDIQEVLGGDGADEISTTANLPVRFFGGPGNDTLIGGPGDDFLVGGSGRNFLSGGIGGTNFFQARNGERDQIFARPGDDGVFDDFDAITNIN